MSGGYIKPQKKGEHQVVHFTFVGDIHPRHAKRWNDSLAKFKGLFGHNLSGITIKGDPTPDEYVKKPAKRKK